MRIARGKRFTYKWPGLVLGLLLVLTMVGWPMVARGESMGPDWLNDQPSVVGRYRVASDKYCYGSTINMRISGLSQKLPVCVLSGQTGGTFFGLWQMPDGRWLYGFGLPGSDYMYQASGCRSDCAYSFSTDTLLTAVYGGGQNSLLMIPHAMSGGKAVNINGQHNFDTPDSQNYLINSSQNRVTVNQFGLSGTGRYIAVSVQSGGEAIVDLSNMTVRQVLNYNPVGNWLGTYDMVAISDDGRFMSVGSNDNDNLVFIDTHGCGTSEMAINNYSPPYLTGWCRTSQFSLKALTSDNGVRETLSSRWSGDNWQGLLLAGDDGLTPYLVTLKASNQPVVSAEYLALGDSFTSGEGETKDSFYLASTNVGDDRCHISSRSYPFLSGVSLGLPTHSVACSGATTSDILGGSSYLGQGNRASDETDLVAMRTNALTNFKPGLIGQVEFVGDYHPSLVTIGIGGNDVGMFSKLRACLMPGECDWASDDGLKKMFQEIDSKADQLMSTYRAIKSQSPASRLFVVGYPEIIADGDDCGVLGGLLDKSERQMMNKAIDHLDDVIAWSAGQVGTKFIDVRQAFSGHRLCEDNKAMNAFRLGDDSSPIGSVDWLKILGNETFHPTPYGHELIATLVSRAILSDQSSPIETIALENSAIDTPLSISSNFSDVATVSPDNPMITVNLENYSFTPGSSVRLTTGGVTIGNFVSSSLGGLIEQVTLPTTETGFEELVLSGQNLDGQTVEYHQTIGVVGDDIATEILSVVKPNAEVDTSEPAPQSSSTLDQPSDQSVKTDAIPSFREAVVSMVTTDDGQGDTDRPTVNRGVLGDSSPNSDVKAGAFNTLPLIIGGGAVLIVAAILVIIIML